MSPPPDSSESALAADRDAGGPLRARILAAGRSLSVGLRETLAALPEGSAGPQQLARGLGLDKVLTSRLLKAARKGDPAAVLFHAPGPEPLRRFLRAARKRGAPTGDADAAVDAFEQLIRHDVGDKSALDAIVSAWLPETQGEFELRRKQAAYKAMSQLKGASARLSLGTVLLHPSGDGARIDVVWIIGLLGLERLRPGVTIKVASRRLPSGDVDARRPATLDGHAVEGLDGLRLDGFCDLPPAPLEVQHAGDVVHYVLGGDAFGKASAVDLLLAEVNFAEMSRTVRKGSGRRGYVFAEVSTPARELLFDVLVHEDVYPGAEPTLLLYDASFDGVADVNDRARDVDRLDLAESVQPLGRGTSRVRVDGAPHHADLVAHVLARLGWDGERFRGWRCRIDYPIYGSQVVMAFDPPEA